MPVIGFLGAASPKAYAPRLIPFLQSLKEMGFIEGENVRIEYRWAGDQHETLPALAAELARLPVSVIIAAGGGQTALAAKSATAKIPIVFQNGSDPVKIGLVASLGRPGGNLTGVTNVSVETASKRIELMRELVPGAKVIGWLNNPRNPNADVLLRDITSAGRALGREIVLVNFASQNDLDPAFATLVQKRVGGLVVGADPIIYNWRDELINRAAHHAIPTMFPNRDFVEAGGLVSYGANFSDVYRQVGVYTSRILKGESPSELPVVQSTKLELIVNNKTAKTLGLDVPLSLLMRIDAVID
jgi:putative ABC transport system substrate-binding protein